MQPTYMGTVGKLASEQTGIAEGTVVLFYLHPEDPNMAMNVRVWAKGNVEAVGISHVSVGPGLIELIGQLEVQAEGKRVL